MSLSRQPKIFRQSKRPQECVALAIRFPNVTCQRLTESDARCMASLTNAADDRIVGAPWRYNYTPQKSIKRVAKLFRKSHNSQEIVMVRTDAVSVTYSRLIPETFTIYTNSRRNSMWSGQSCTHWERYPTVYITTSNLIITLFDHLASRSSANLITGNIGKKDSCDSGIPDFYCNSNYMMRNQMCYHILKVLRVTWTCKLLPRHLQWGKLRNISSRVILPAHVTDLFTLISILTQSSLYPSKLTAYLGDLSYKSMIEKNFKKSCSLKLYLQLSIK